MEKQVSTLLYAALLNLHKDVTDSNINWSSVTTTWWISAFSFKYLFGNPYESKIVLSAAI